MLQNIFGLFAVAQPSQLKNGKIKNPLAVRPRGFFLENEKFQINCSFVFLGVPVESTPVHLYLDCSELKRHKKSSTLSLHRSPG